jgi:WD40 repeat protein
MTLIDQGYCFNCGQWDFPDLTAGGDHTARVWNAASGQLLATLRGHSDYVFSAVFSPDSQRILTANEDKTARVWNVAGNAGGGQLLATVQGHPGYLLSAVFSPDSQRILIADGDSTARVFQLINLSEMTEPWAR